MTTNQAPRRSLLRGLALFLGLAIGTPLLAHAAPAANPAVLAPIQSLDQGLLTVMKQGKSTPFSQRVAELTPAIDNALNLPAILRAAIGPDWSKMTPEEQNRLLTVFRNYTIATFVENFDNYNGQRIVLSPKTRTLSSGAQIVHTEIVSGNGKDTHSLDYVMRKDAQGNWKATDVLADGTISRVAVLHSDFSDLLSRGGVPALEASLQKKTQALQSG
jgi:phospholipid transport system substrate-binding protein